MTCEVLYRLTYVCSEPWVECLPHATFFMYEGSYLFADTVLQQQQNQRAYGKIGGTIKDRTGVDSGHQVVAAYCHLLYMGSI